jgi:hypothetical protein
MKILAPATALLSIPTNAAARAFDADFTPARDRDHVVVAYCTTGSRPSLASQPEGVARWQRVRLTQAYR